MHNRLYPRSSEIVVGTIVLRQSCAAKGRLALGNHLVFLLWWPGGGLLRHCQYCRTVWFARRPCCHTYGLLPFTCSVVTVPTAAHHRPGQTRALPAYVACLQGEIANVDVHMGSRQLLPVLRRIGSDPGCQRWLFGALVGCKTAGGAPSTTDCAAGNPLRCVPGHVH